MVPTDAAHSQSLANSEMELAVDGGRTESEYNSFLLNPDLHNKISSTRRSLQPAAATEPSLAFRVFDVTVAGLILVFVLPLMSICIFAIRLSGPGPVIFRQRRIGRNGREFTCLKFRTMIDRAESALDQVLSQNSHATDEWAAVQKLRADPRITRTGYFLRRYCLDELPQLLNVLKGEMSIVGPRPIVADEIRRYGSNFSHYCSVNPGLTGLWQVSGLHALPYCERVRLDAEYAASKSLRLDLLILWKTVPIVLFGRNG